MQSNSQKLGLQGENYAEKYYMENGYKIAEKNFRTRHGEIDIIATKAGVYVFIEVKTRAKNAIAKPREWVNASKQKRIVTAALEYLAQNNISEPPMRFDVAEILLENGKNFKLHCFENAFTL